MSIARILGRAALVAGVIAALAPAAQAQSAKEWFPLHENDFWELTDANNNAYRISCDYEYGEMRYVSGLAADPVWLTYWSGAPMSLYNYNWDSASWQPWARFGYRWTPWTFAFNDGGCGRFDARRAATGITVRTPAGTFTGCNTIRYTPRPAPNVFCAQPEIATITFAPNVGPVRVVSKGVTYSLARASVGGVSYPQTSGGMILASVTTDLSTYTNYPNTIRCITTPCPGNERTATATFTLTITNGTSQDQQFVFSSGCQANFEILDTNGSVVASLSERIFCTMAFTQFTLAPGQSKSFSTPFELKDRNDVQLDGTYIVRGSLLTYVQSPASIQPAMSSFQVVLSPTNTFPPNP